MFVDPKSISTTVIRLLTVVGLLSWPQFGSAAGTWSVMPFPGKPGEVSSVTDTAVDAVGNLYVSDWSNYGMIQKRDAQGNWSVIAPYGSDLGQVWNPTALAADTAGSLYVADGRPDGWFGYSRSRVQKRDAQGDWSVIATYGTDLGQVFFPRGLAVDTAGNLCVVDLVDTGSDRIQKRDAQGNWSVIATSGTNLGQVNSLSGLAVDAAGNLYVADSGNNRVQVYTANSGP
jgi:DNA-binding beta-propeller fold protein YncE